VRGGSFWLISQCQENSRDFPDTGVSFGCSSHCEVRRGFDFGCRLHSEKEGITAMSLDTLVV